MLDVSIITATYNSENTIRDCLSSIQGQRDVAVEHIVIDGGSKDRTAAIVRNSGNVSQFISEPDHGIYDAMNKGIKQATGDIIGILNGDDFYLGENTLSQVVDSFSDPGVDACYGDLVYVCQGTVARQQGTEFLAQERTFKVVRYWKSGKFNLRKFYWGWMPPHPTFFVRRELYERYGLFNLELGSAADYEIMLRFLVKHQVHVAYIPEVLVRMRTGGVSNASLKNRLAANRMDRKAWMVNGLHPYPWSLWMKPLRKVGQWYFLKI